MLSQWLSPEMQYVVFGIMLAFTPSLIVLALLVVHAHARDNEQPRR